MLKIQELLLAHLGVTLMKLPGGHNKVVPLILHHSWIQYIFFTYELGIYDMVCPHFYKIFYTDSL